jgi:hypothetical protein
MKHYEQYPTMKPYVGSYYPNTTKPSLLLIGESHYIPEDSTLDTAPAIWYSGTSESLSEDELYYISTAKIIEESRAEAFSNKAHSIWRNSFLEINEFGPRYADFMRISDDIAFYNFFLRPAFTGDSLIVTPQDIEIANEAFHIHYKTLKPTAVVFLSRLAFNYFQPATPISVPVIATPHPGCKWWNKSAQKYGNRRGRDILGDFIKTINWPKASDCK